MPIRPSNDPYNNPAGLIDQRFGEMYHVVEEVSSNMPVLKQISSYMDSLLNITKNLDMLKALGSNTTTLDFIKNNIVTLSNYFAVNDALINNKASLTTNNVFEGFTQLGKNAPKVKHKLISFQTGSIDTKTVVPHFLNLSKMYDYSTVVSTSDNMLTKPRDDIYSVTVGPTDITLTVSNGSLLAANRTCKMLFTYTE